jgi:hypothetical protein
MKINKVKIVSAQSECLWYACAIGSEFFCAETAAFPDWKYRVIHVGLHESEPPTKYIDDRDAEFLYEFDGDIVRETYVDISVRRD